MISTDDIKTVQKVSLDEKDILVVTVNTDGMRPATSRLYMEEILEHVKVYFFTNKVMVIPHNVSFAVMTPKEKKNE